MFENIPIQIDNEEQYKMVQNFFNRKLNTTFRGATKYGKIYLVFRDYGLCYGRQSDCGIVSENPRTFTQFLVEIRKMKLERLK